MLGTGPSMTEERFAVLLNMQKSPGNAGAFRLCLQGDQPSKNSFIRAKKPADSGLFSFYEISSNSFSSSRWRLVSFCGVSIWIWM